MMEMQNIVCHASESSSVHRAGYTERRKSDIETLCNVKRKTLHTKPFNQIPDSVAMQTLVYPCRFVYGALAHDNLPRGLYTLSAAIITPKVYESLATFAPSRAAVSAGSAGRNPV